MRISIGSNIRITDPTPEIVKWAKDNLTLPNPEYTKKVRMGFWVGRTPSHLTLYEWQGDTLVLPYGTHGSIIPMAHGTIPESRFADGQLVEYGRQIPLYGYQEKAVDAMMWHRYGILQSAAGSGKTQMGLATVIRWGKRALWLCHTADLLRQSKERAEQYIDKSLIGTITEGKIRLGKGITFATVQTMCNIDLLQYRDFWDVIIVDEAHRVSGSPSTLTRYYKVLNNLAARHKYGLTATPDRSDGLIKATYALVGNVMYTVPDEEIADKIMKVCVKPIWTGMGPSKECFNPDGTLNFTGMIGYLAADPGRNTLISGWIMYEKDHSCLILSDRLEQLEKLIENLPTDMREKAIMITGKMTSKKAKAEREQALEQMQK